MTEQQEKSSFAWVFVVLFAISTSALGWFYYQAMANGEQLTSDLAQAQSSIRRLERDVSELESELASSRANAERLRQQNNQLNQQLSEATLQISRLTEQSSLAENQRSEIDQIRGELEQVNGDNAQLRLQVNQLQQELSSKTAALTEAQTTEELYQQAREQLALQQAENESYSETIERLRSEMAAESQAMESLEEKLQGQLETLSAEKQQLVSQLEDGTTVIQLPESILFPTGSAQLSDEGLEALSVLADAMQSFPNHLISVQGHTDGRSISPETASVYPTNWELSSARASSAVRELVKLGVNGQQLQAVGLADTQPLVEEVDAATRAQNRRIEVLLFPNQFKTRVLNKP